MQESKIIELDALAVICKKLKKHGKKIVQCHGCFDLLHPGHVYHFQAAKKLGDVLIVTVTPDKFVYKGPGRPVFNEKIRMDFIASIGVVDYVALNKWETGTKTILLLKPDIYAKGNDYSDRKKDITGKIYEEEQAVKSVGGKLKCTDEPTFSSTEIINKHYNPLSKEAQEYINKLKEKFTAKSIIKQIEKLKDLKVLVIGDLIIDEYAFCKALGMPEKAAVVSTKYLFSENYAGGCLAVANHIADFVHKVTVLTVIGNDDKSKLWKNSMKSNVEVRCIPREKAPTITKKRYLEQWSKAKLFEVAEMDDTPLNSGDEFLLKREIQRNKEKHDMIIVTDFGHGLITKNIQKELKKTNLFMAVNAQTNSANHGYNMITKYEHADYISIDEQELRLPYKEKYGELSPLLSRLSADTKCNKINITLGAKGSLYYHNGKKHLAPVLSSKIVDTVGAGDAVLSLTSLLAYQDIAPELMPFIGNVAGAIKVETMGNKEPIQKTKVLKFINAVMR